MHDGPGIRTLVYMKGCPLKCLWCSSPQTQKKAEEIIHLETSCLKCGLCVTSCESQAISFSPEQGPIINRETCDACGACADACPNQALELAGYISTVDELYKEIAKDSPFYRRSNGGVTVGGGEATMQHEFVTEFLKTCKKKYIHTVMETCGFISWEHLKEMLNYLDLVYMDVKHLNPDEHKKITGVSNELIIENVRMVSEIRPLIIRIPIIPGLNDSEENISATAQFASTLGEKFERIELLPYHKFGTQTYGRLGRTYTLDDTESPTDDHMEQLKKIIEKEGIETQIGG